jgi:tetrahydromethanopterin S-methyltransferase subunit B
MTGELDNWSEYRRLVLAELDRLNKAIEGLDNKIDQRERENSDKNAKRDRENGDKDAVRDRDLLTLKLKASIYGAMSGAVFSAIVAIITALFYKWPMKL